MVRSGSQIVGAALAVALFVGSPAVAGPLRDCCSAKGAFCILPFVGGAPGCTAAGGMFFVANACIRSTQECGVAHQQAAAGQISVQLRTPAGGVTDTVPLQGGADVIETELIQLDLTGTGPVIGPVRVQTNPLPPSTGSFNPPRSFFDVFFEIQVSGLPTLSNPIPQHIEATGVGTFPPLGIPYQSTSPVPLIDPAGNQLGLVSSLSIVLLPFPDADGDGVADANDLCPGTPAGAAVNDDGCSVQQLCPCQTARTSGGDVSCVAHAAHAFAAAGILTPSAVGPLVREAAHSRCGVLP